MTLRHGSEGYMMKTMYRVINYLEEFKCLADKCPDTCCSGWAIEIDEKSLKKYSEVSNSYSEILTEKIDADECVFRQKENGDCSFLCENKLCDMYIALGEKALCDTCRLYPRHIEEYGDGYEMNLSASCPEAARILLAQEEPIAMVDTDYYEVAGAMADCDIADDDENADGEYSDGENAADDGDEFDWELYRTLLDTRADLMDIVRDRSIPYKDRAVKIVKVASELQDKLDGIEKNAEEQFDELDEEYFYLVSDIFECLKELEYLKPSREGLLNEAEILLFSEGSDHWLELHKAFTKYCDENNLKLELKKEQITAYYLYSYFCGAVYDNYVFAKAFGAVAHTVLISELWIAKWVQNGKCICSEDMVNIFYEYARELENSNPNLIKMDEMLDDFKIDVDMLVRHNE